MAVVHQIGSIPGILGATPHVEEEIAKIPERL
jgi:hypothetical protein